MGWLKSWLGLSTPLEKKKKELSNIRVRAVMAQRDGDLRRYAVLSKKIEALEDNIVEMIERGNG